MNVFIKKLCLIMAVVCFMLCVTGGFGAIMAAPQVYKMPIGFVCAGISLFVLFSMLVLSALCSPCKEDAKCTTAPKTTGGEQRRTPRPMDRPVRKDRPAPAAKPAVKAAEKPAPRPDIRPAVKPAEKVAAVSERTQPAASEKFNDKFSDKFDNSIDNDIDDISDDDIRRDTGEQIPEESGSATLYVANLSADVNEVDLREEFEVFGQVKSVRLVTDKESGSSKGYAFVEMNNKAEASLAIDDINGQEIKGQQVNVSFARKKPAFNRRWNNKR